ncbi:hypothetical protein L798_10808 [Zootermopsis nevadensis]|uniref:Uncharacterized protein n=1 Tax=Zootermopsis nevadensis TaxID=136037 RepID=A0A067RSZ6_ZOONE|nr:hypothetical protein L798_10808 [Zootermopsis nevadensis]
MNGIRDLVRWCINTVYMACSRVANYVRRNDFPQSGHDMIEGGDNVTPRAPTLAEGRQSITTVVMDLSQWLTRAANAAFCIDSEDTVNVYVTENEFVANSESDTRGPRPLERPIQVIPQNVIAIFRDSSDGRDANEDSTGSSDVPSLRPRYRLPRREYQRYPRRIYQRNHTRRQNKTRTPGTRAICQDRGTQTNEINDSGISDGPHHSRRENAVVNGQNLLERVVVPEGTDASVSGVRGRLVTKRNSPKDTRCNERRILDRDRPSLREHEVKVETNRGGRKSRGVPSLRKGFSSVKKGFRWIKRAVTKKCRKGTDEVSQQITRKPTTRRNDEERQQTSEIINREITVSPDYLRRRNALYHGRNVRKNEVIPRGTDPSVSGDRHLVTKPNTAKNTHHEERRLRDTVNPLVREQVADVGTHEEGQGSSGVPLVPSAQSPSKQGTPEIPRGVANSNSTQIAEEIYHDTQQTSEINNSEITVGPHHSRRGNALNHGQNAREHVVIPRGTDPSVSGDRQLVTKPNMAMCLVNSYGSYDLSNFPRLREESNHDGAKRQARMPGPVASAGPSNGSRSQQITELN